MGPGQPNLDVPLRLSATDGLAHQPAVSDAYCAQVVASIVIVCAGVGVSTVSDTDLGSNYIGWAVGAGAVAATAAYQIWAGTKQKELGAGSMQLLEQYAPIAAFMLFLLVPICEPMGWTDRSPGTLLGYEYSPAAVWLASFIGVTLLPTFWHSEIWLFETVSMCGGTFPAEASAAGLSWQVLSCYWHPCSIGKKPAPSGPDVPVEVPGK